jgi:hypothetical protein
MPANAAESRSPSTSAAVHGDPAVLELQQLLVKYGYMTKAQLETGPGILGAQTRGAVSRVLDGKEPVAPINPPTPKASSTLTPKQPKDTASDTWFYIVHGVDNLESLAHKWGVTVSNLLAHPENLFLKELQRMGKLALQPGDRIALPPHVQAKVSKAKPTQDSSTINSLVEYLLHLTDEHPASKTGGAKPQQNQSAKKQTKASSQQTKPPPTSTFQIQGYTKKHSRIWPKVVLTKPIESAFLVLLPYLPKETVMTSGYRSDADQERVINEYYAQHKGNPLEKNVEKRRQWLQKEKNLIIAKVGSSPHRTGFAFDLSGGKLSTIQAAVDRCVKEQGDKFPLLKTIVERNQNCLHVNLKPTMTRTS